ncbi:hypothetical protein V9T40_009699 [Parthenolecanium corni]|uniref:Uncharacterized protein n=1 Tax=Parthenolecanium corni TaxID=536013 RepID=A0AAN9U1C2_9HEMI
MPKTTVNKLLLILVKTQQQRKKEQQQVIASPIVENDPPNPPQLCPTRNTPLVLQDNGSESCATCETPSPIGESIPEHSSTGDTLVAVNPEESPLHNTMNNTPSSNHPKESPQRSDSSNTPPVISHKKSLLPIDFSSTPSTKALSPQLIDSNYIPISSGSKQLKYIVQPKQENKQRQNMKTSDNGDNIEFSTRRTMTQLETAVAAFKEAMKEAEEYVATVDVIADGIKVHVNFLREGIKEIKSIVTAMMQKQKEIFDTPTKVSEQEKEIKLIERIKFSQLRPPVRRAPFRRRRSTNGTPGQSAPWECRAIHCTRISGKGRCQRPAERALS